MSYILEVTNKINIEYQSGKPKLHKLLPIIKAYYKNILSNFIQRKFLSDDTCFTVDFISDVNVLKGFLKVDDIYMGAAAIQILESGTDSQNDAREVKQRCRAYYIELCYQINQRINFEDPTLLAVQALNPKKLGETLMPLIRLFPNLVPECGMNVLECEWRELLTQDVQQGTLTLEDFWCKIFDMETVWTKQCFLIFANLLDRC